MLGVERPWWHHPLAVLDFETTGVDPETCMPVSVACVRFEAGEEVDRFYSLVNPGCPIPQDASRIHGITDTKVANAPPVETLAPYILAVAKHAVPVAYNSFYDRTILHRFITGTDCPMFDTEQEWVCPLVIIRGLDRYVAGPGRHRLQTTCKRWGVELEDAHNALADARATGRLLWKMRERLGDMTADRLISAVCKRRAEQESDFESWRASQPTRRQAGNG